MWLIKLYQKSFCPWVALSRRMTQNAKGFAMTAGQSPASPLSCVTGSAEKVKATVVSSKYFKAFMYPHISVSWTVWTSLQGQLLLLPSIILEAFQLVPLLCQGGLQVQVGAIVGKLQCTVIQLQEKESLSPACSWDVHFGRRNHFMGPSGVFEHVFEHQAWFWNSDHN